MLSAHDKQALIAYAQNELHLQMTADVMKIINGYAFMYDNLAEAQKQLRLKYAGPAVFNNLAPVVQVWPNSLLPWLPAPDVATLPRYVQTVGMTASVTTDRHKTKYILATQSLMGCLGVVAIGPDAVFLAHWIPTQLTANDMAARLAEINDKVGVNAMIHLSSPSIPLGAPYVALFRAAALVTHQIAAEHHSQRLAVNAMTGAVLTEFSVDGLPPD